MGLIPSSSLHEPLSVAADAQAKQCCWVSIPGSALHFFFFFVILFLFLFLFVLPIRHLVESTWCWCGLKVGPHFPLSFQAWIRRTNSSISSNWISSPSIGSSSSLMPASNTVYKYGQIWSNGLRVNSWKLILIISPFLLGGRIFIIFSLFYHLFSSLIFFYSLLYQVFFSYLFLFYFFFQIQYCIYWTWAHCLKDPIKHAASR